jgi:hypothetical protein
MILTFGTFTFTFTGTGMGCRWAFGSALIVFTSLLSFVFTTVCLEAGKEVSRIEFISIIFGLPPDANEIFGKKPTINIVAKLFMIELFIA